MLKDYRIRILHDFIDSKECFPSADIAGGVSYLLWDKTYKGKCRVTTHKRHIFSTIERKLDEFDIFIRDNIGLNVIHKIQKKSPKTMDEGVLQLSPFGLRTYVRGEKESWVGCVKLISSEGVGYISPEEITRNFDKIYTYKVVIGRLVPSNGEVGIDPSKGYKAITLPQMIGSGEVVTETYLVVATLKSEPEAVNCVKSLKTKFSRFLIRLTFSSMNVNRANFRFVPLQDFTDKSDIDWSVSVAEIDKQLYKKYGLTQDEIDYIESTIKPMD